MIPSRPSSLAAALAAAVSLLAVRPARAHCDALDGPVVAAAREALRTGDAASVVIWVEKEKEAEVRDALRRALAVRAASAEAKDLADTWFFETVVRLHRAGEGEPYAGLRAAGQAEPFVVAADRAVATGSTEALRGSVPEAAVAGLGAALRDVVAKKAAHRPGDVEAGRAYVKAYVGFLHAVEEAVEEAHESAKAPPSAVVLKSPKALAEEHEELHERVGEAIALGGETEKAARALIRVLHPHFVREDQIATPPLALLPALAEGRVTPDMRPALEMTRALRAELPRMLEEHVAIKAAFRALGAAAQREGHVKIANFSVRLVRHAETEEQVLYPAALLVGSVLEERLGK